MPVLTEQRRYECRRCGVVAYAESRTGRMPVYCPLCRPRVKKRGGTGGVDIDTPAYRLALATTTLRLGIEQARRRLLDVHLDNRATSRELRQAITEAIAALDDAETDQTRDLETADFLVDVSSDGDTTVAEP